MSSTGLAVGVVPRERVLHRLSRRFREESLLVVIGAAFVLFACKVLAEGAIKPDSWLSFLGGREIVSRGLPHHDELAVMSHGHSWIDQQWLAQLALYGLDSAGGIKLAILASILIQLAALGLAFVFARRSGASPASIAPFALLAWLVLSSWLRAQVFAQLLFVVLIGLLAAESRKPSRRVFLALPLLALWANLHGSVLVGAALVVLLGVTELGRSARSRAAGKAAWARSLILVTSPLLCVFASPYGFELASYYRSTIGNGTFRSFLTEWAPPSMLSVNGTPFLLLAGAVLALVALRPRDLTGFELGALALTFVNAAFAARSISWFSYAALVLVPPLLERTRGAARPARMTAPLAAAAVAIAMATVASTAAQPASSFTKPYPTEAAAIVTRFGEQHPNGRVLASPELADWLLYVSPSTRGRMAFDGRWELFSAGQVKGILRYLFVVGTDWERVSRGYRLIVLDPESEPRLVATYEKRPGIRALFRSPRVVIFERTS